MSVSSRCLVCSVALCLLLLFCADRSAAQTATAEILGTVTDNSGGVLPGAQVTIKNLGIGVTRTMAANESGDYVFTFLPVGSYSVSIEAQRFKTFTAPNVALSVGDHARVDARMQLGDVKENIEVTAEAAATLQTDSATVGGLVTTRAVEDLPVNGRNVIRLVQLVAGANEGALNAPGNGTRPDDHRLTSSVSVNGQSDLLNNYMIDGLDNNERIIGVIGIRPSIDALEEVKVSTSLITADVSRVAGAVINMITKSGTNALHGSLFEFVRNDMFDAKDFFNVPQAGNPLAGVKPKYRQNQFGGSLGGPIIKNKMFFFGDYEGLRIVQGQTATATVPTPCELGRTSCNGVTQLGNFSDLLPSGTVIYDSTQAKPAPFPNNIIPLSRINSVAANYAALLPTSNACPATSLACQFVNSPIKTQSADTLDARIDYHFGDKDFLYGRYSFNNTNTFVPGLLSPVAVAGMTVQPGGNQLNVVFPGSAPQRFQSVGVTYTHIFRPNLLFQLSAGFLGSESSLTPLNFGHNVSTAFGLAGANVSTNTAGLSLVQFSNGGYSTLGDAPYDPLYDWDDALQLTGAVTWTKGTHIIKFGANLLRRYASNYQSQYGMGTFAFSSQQTNSAEGGSGGTGGNSFASLVLGVPISVARNLSLVKQRYRMWEAGTYVQDDWRVTSRLTLNLGVRWDLYTPFTEANNHLSDFDPTNQTMLAGAQVLVAGQNGFSATAGMPTEWHDFQPRIGFAATLGRGTVLRGGFGMTSAPANYASPNTLKNEPFVNVVSQNTPLGQPGPNLPVFGTPLPPATPSSTCLSPACGSTTVISIPAATVAGRQWMLIYQTNLVLEKEFAGNIVNAGYVGTYGRNLGKVLPNVNLPAPPLGPGGCGQTTAITLPSPCQPYYAQIPDVTFIQMVTSNGISNYSAFQANFQRRFKGGLTFSANYTYGRNLGDTYDGPRGTCTGCGIWINNPGYDYGNSMIDVRHRIAITANYELPFGKSLKGISGYMARGWQINGVYLFSSGLPDTVLNSASPQINVGNSGGTANLSNTTGDRPNLLQPSASFHPSLHQWFDTTTFAMQPFGTGGNEGHNDSLFYGPAQKRLDLSVMRDFPIKERVRLQFRVETFNLTNTPSFANPASGISGWNAGVPTQAGNFGVITATSTFYTPRDIQFALKLLF